MKYLYIGILILGLLLLSCFWSEQAIKTRTEAVAAPLEAALAAEPERAAALAEAAAAEWARSRSLMASLLSHEATDKVETMLTDLVSLRGTAFTRACEKALRAVRALAEAQRLLWRNIF